MRTPEEIIGADAVAALEAEGYTVAESSDLWPPIRFVTQHQADAQRARMLDALGAVTYPSQTHWVDAEGREHHWERMCNTFVEIIDEAGNG